MAKYKMNEDINYTAKELEKIKDKVKEVSVAYQEITGRSGKWLQTQKDLSKAAEISVTAEERIGRYKGINVKWSKKLASLADDTNDLMLAAINNEKNIGTEKFKQIDLTKLLNKRRELENARLEAGVDLTEEQGREIQSQINDLDTIIRHYGSMVYRQEQLNDLAKQGSEILINQIDRLHGFLRSVPGGGFFLEKMGLGEKAMEKLKEKTWIF